MLNSEPYDFLISNTTLSTDKTFTYNALNLEIPEEPDKPEQPLNPNEPAPPTPPEGEKPKLEVPPKENVKEGKGTLDYFHELPKTGNTIAYVGIAVLMLGSILVMVKLKKIINKSPLNYKKSRGNEFFRYITLRILEPLFQG